MLYIILTEFTQPWHYISLTYLVEDPDVVEKLVACLCWILSRAGIGQIGAGHQ